MQEESIYHQRQREKSWRGSGELVATNQLFIFRGESVKCEGALTQKKERSNVLKSSAFNLQKVLFSTCLRNLSQMF